MKKYLIIALTILTANISLVAQDIHFSQYNENPSLINPALTGAYYVMRASAVYRDQWASVTTPYRTFGASYEMKFRASEWEKQDPFKTKLYKKAYNRLAGGLSFYSDKAGDGQMSTNYGTVSLATFIKTGAFSSLSLGLQGGIIHKSVNYANFIFPNQYDGTTYNNTLPTGEPVGSRSFVAPDVNAGLLWYYGKEESSIGENNHVYADVGFSMMHINKPKQKFLPNDFDRLYSKYIVHGKLLIGLPHSNVSLAPSFMSQFQGPQMEFVCGMHVKYSIKNDTKYTGFIKKSYFGLGVFYRSMDAVIANVLLEMGHYAIGISYDLNISGLTKVTTLRGGPEITLRYNSTNRFLFQKK